MISFWSRLLDLISPRLCVVCGNRLAVTEETLCSKCYLHLPRTDFANDLYESVMAKLFWGQIKLEKATALFYYEPHAETAQILYELKYKNHPEIGVVMGRMMAKELMKSGLFEDIDALVPVPLAKKRERERGYNQSLELAKGVSEVTGLPIANLVIRRTKFVWSQTQRGRWERNENVAHVFELVDENISGQHLLLIDDVVTTGATVIACAKEMQKASNVKISVLALGFAKS
jgi:ComF family protein